MNVSLYKLTNIWTGINVINKIFVRMNKKNQPTGKGRKVYLQFQRRFGVKDSITRHKIQVQKGPNASPTSSDNLCYFIKWQSNEAILMADKGATLKKDEPMATNRHSANWCDQSNRNLCMRLRNCPQDLLPKAYAPKFTFHCEIRCLSW